MPKDQWPTLNGLRKDNQHRVLLFMVCHLAATAAVEFTGKGYPVMELGGGWRWWKEDGFDVEK